MFETFEHPSDIGIRGSGKNLSEAFAEAAKAMFSVIADISHFQAEIDVPIECSASDQEMLLFEFLNKLLLEAAVHRAVFIDFEIAEISKTHLKAKAVGEKIKSSHKNLFGVEVKAATFTQLKVFEEKKKFIAQCVIDV